MSLAANKVWTRGPTHWHHVSLLCWFMWMFDLYKMFWESAGFDPGTSPSMQRLNNTPLTNGPTLVTCFVCQHIYIYVCELYYFEKGAGRGPAPTHRLLYISIVLCCRLARNCIVIQYIALQCITYIICVLNHARGGLNLYHKFNTCGDNTFCIRAGVNPFTPFSNG